VVSLPGRANVFFRTFILSQLIGELLDREIARAGGDSRDLGTLSGIGILGPVTPTELAGFLGMAPTTLSAVLRRLEQAGALRRRRNPDDGRSVLVELTAKGRKRWESAWPGLRASLDKVDAELVQPVPTVLSAMDELERALRAALAR
jgi:DNA-binding MarR family transcriptional regulator